MPTDILTQLPPEMVETIVTTTTAVSGWLWGKYGQKAADKAGEEVREKWDKRKWDEYIEAYRDSLLERVAFIRILGRHNREPLDNVFTHVNVLDKITATRWYDVERLQAEFAPRDFVRHERRERISGEEAVDAHEKLFILGKPGAGKTTFLKHTALRTLQGKLDGNKLPIFVTLKELSDAGETIEAFITKQFAVHGFPSAGDFVTDLLTEGDALVLFDGLDEVNLAGEQRAQMITQLENFVLQYRTCPMMITCRVAAADYTFENANFEYVEMADFDRVQIGGYIDKWFKGDETKRDSCRRELLGLDENKAVLELAQTPLILALLCLVYEELNAFPPKRHEIYAEATRALLSKWDASRNIRRDGIYKQFSLDDKHELLAYIAAQTFEAGDYFLEEDALVPMIKTFMEKFAGVEDADGYAVLRAMEAQHGILVERARRIHSFSHLTLQEYYKAWYIVRNERRGTVRHLMQHVGDDRWREVFLMTATMLSDVSLFCEQYLDRVESLLKNNTQLIRCLAWCGEKCAYVQNELPYKPVAICAWYMLRVRDRSRTFSRDMGFDREVFGYDKDGPDRDLIIKRGHIARHNSQTNLRLATNLDLHLAIDRALTLALAHNHERDFYHDLEPAESPDQNWSQAENRSRALKDAIKLTEQAGYVEFATALRTIHFPHYDENKYAPRKATYVPREATYVSRKAWDTFKIELQKIINNSEYDFKNPYEIIHFDERHVIYDEPWRWSDEQIAIVGTYLEANLLLVECMKIARLPKATRLAIENRMLMPPQ